FTTLTPPSSSGIASGFVSASSAGLTATVNPNGLATSVYFEYGLTTNYGSATISQAVGSGTSDASVSAPLSGLQSGAAYHFRIVTMSAAGTFYGADQTFGTLPVSDILVYAATGITINAANLSATVNANSITTGAYFEYGTTMSYGSVTTAQTISGTSGGDVSATLSSLAPGTVYHFRVST